MRKKGDTRARFRRFRCSREADVGRQRRRFRALEEAGADCHDHAHGGDHGQDSTDV
jgi:hypothetical protein